MNKGTDHPGTWYRAYIDKRRSDGYKCKEYPWTKYDHDELALGGRLINPEDPIHEEQVSLDWERDNDGYSTEPSPYPDDEDFIIVNGPGTTTRVSKNCGPRFMAIIYSAINRRFQIAQDDDERKILSTYIEHEIEHTILGIAHRDDQSEGHVRVIGTAGIEWMLHHVFLPLMHYERSITMENIIAHACQVWGLKHTAAEPGPYNSSLEYAAESYVQAHFGDRRSRPKCKSFYKYLALLCDDYLHHAYKMRMDYTLNTELIIDAYVEPIFPGACLSTPFTFGMAFRCTPEAWTKHLRETRITLCHSLVLLDKKSQARSPHTNGEDRPKPFSPFEYIRIIMSYVGDDPNWYVKHYPDKLPDDPSVVVARPMERQRKRSRITVAQKRPRQHHP